MEVNKEKFYSVTEMAALLGVKETLVSAVIKQLAVEPWREMGSWKTNLYSEINYRLIRVKVLEILDQQKRTTDTREAMAEEAIEDVCTGIGGLRKDLQRIKDLRPISKELTRDVAALTRNLKAKARTLQGIETSLRTLGKLKAEVRVVSVGDISHPEAESILKDLAGLLTDGFKIQGAPNWCVTHEMCGVSFFLVKWTPIDSPLEDEDGKICDDVAASSAADSDDEPGCGDSGGSGIGEEPCPGILPDAVDSGGIEP